MFQKIVLFVKQHIVLSVIVIFIVLLSIVNGGDRSTILIPIFIFLAFLLYFLPSVIAYKRKRKNINAITVLNLFLGWTVIGWIVSLVWAVSEDK